MARTDSSRPATETTQTADPAPTGWTFEVKSHPRIRFGDLVVLDLRARLLGDLRHSGVENDDLDLSSFDLARRRIGVDGRIGDDLQFQIEREFTRDTPWRDVYADYRVNRVFQVQAGKFKLPFGLDENTGSSDLDFTYRSRVATELSPGRDRGVMAHGRPIRLLRYEFGVFVHDGDNARAKNSTRVFGEATTAGRLVWQPYRSSKSTFEDFQVGAAFTTSEVPEGIADLGGQTAFGVRFMPRRFYVQGQRRRLGLETRWRPRSFSIQSEIARMSNERRGQSVDETDLPALVGTAWYVSGAWIVTGERMNDGPREPKRPLLQGGYGLVELAARIERLRYAAGGSQTPSTAPRGDTISPYTDTALTLAANWSPNRWTRVQFNLIRDAIVSPSEALPASAWSRVLRFQFVL